MTPNTYINPSKIHGLGLFANEDINCQTEIIQGEIDFNINIKEWIRYNKKNKKRSFALDRGYCMINHSISPNTYRNTEKQIFALFDIKKGEEITENYYSLSETENPFLNPLEEIIYRAALNLNKSRLINQLNKVK